MKARILYHNEEQKSTGFADRIGSKIAEDDPVRKLVETCEGCPHLGKCHKSSRGFREIKVNRSIQVEGAFGVLKHDYAFRRFLFRGKRNIEMQCFLLAFALNNQVKSSVISQDSMPTSESVSKIIFLISGFIFMTKTSRQRSLPFYVDVLRWFRASEIEVIDLKAAKLVV